MKIEEFNEKEGQLLVGCDEEQKTYVKLEADIWDDLLKYGRIHKYPDRIFVFTKSNGKQLTPDSTFHTLKKKSKNMR